MLAGQGKQGHWAALLIGLIIDSLERPKEGIGKASLIGRTRHSRGDGGQP